MPQNRATRRRIITYAMLVAASLLLLATSTTAPLQELRRAVNFAISPIQDALTGATRSVTSVFNAVGEIDQLRRQNEALTTQAEQLRTRVQQLEALKAENDLLTALLGLRGALSYQTLPATVISRQAKQYERVVTLNRGTQDGIAVGDPVLSGGGALAGAVTDVGANYASVMLMTDTRSVVIGMIESSRATGEVDGRLSGPLAMSKIPTTEKVAVDDIVVTAGLDVGTDLFSPFPKGLLIGRVVQVQSDATDIVQTALIEPAADLENLEYVLVITDYQPPDIPTPGASPKATPRPTATPKR